MRRHLVPKLVAATVVAGAAMGTPGALAQVDEWQGSAFPAATRDAAVFEVGGHFEKAANSRFDPNEAIVAVTVSFARGEAVPESCAVPGAHTDSGNGTSSGSRDERRLAYDFAVPAGHEWQCNGRYRVVARAATNRYEEKVLESTLTVAIPPSPVAAVDAAPVGEADADDGPTDDRPEQVTVSWQKLESPVQSAGYRVERQAPGSSEWTALAEVAEDAEPAVVDTVGAPGEYRYRVRSLRSGADGPIPSPEGTTPTARVRLAGPDGTVPTTAASGGAPSSTTTSRGLTLPSPRRSTTSRRNTAGTSRTTPTTADTGFSETLDYGERELPELDDELAGNGQSIIQDEGEGGGTGMLGPVAGALVLIGWAGHVAYLNRLSKQL